VQGSGGIPTIIAADFHLKKKTNSTAKLSHICNGCFTNVQAVKHDATFFVLTFHADILKTHLSGNKPG